jgi:serine/threonine protein kinase/lipopolysaccharide biosynthesis regulator YciM
MVCAHCGAEVPARERVCSTCGRPPAAAADTESETLFTPSASPPPGERTGGFEERPSTDLSQIGTPFGRRYHLIRQLGTGAMGTVYQAWDEELAVVVAIKVIRPEAMADPAAARDLERRFKRELLLARNVTHKNVVRIHDLGEIEGVKYITMPYVNGADLATILDRETKLPVARALSIARQVASGLVAAHDAGVVHRDLKPANILLDEDDHALITDFGIARSLTGPGGGTTAGTIMGTLDYMAPEQARGEAVDHRADIYAFGLILADMLIGRQRAGGGDRPIAGLLDRIVKAPVPMRSVDPSIPQALDELVLRCVRTDPARRYQRTQELLIALEAIAGPVAAQTGSAGTGRYLAPARRSETIPKSLLGVLTGSSRKWIAGAVLAVVLAGGGFVLYRALSVSKPTNSTSTTSDATVKELAASFEPSTTVVTALRYYNEGLGLDRQGRHLEALKKFQASTQEDGNFALAYSKLAESYAAVGRSGEAEKSSRRAIALAESLPQTEKYFVLASRARTVWDPQKAIEYYEKLEALLPNNDDVLLALANLHAEAGAYDKASSRLGKLLERDSKNIGALLLTGRVRIEIGKPEGGLDFLNRALTLSIHQGNDEARAGALSLLGSDYWVLNKPQDALRYFGEALQIYRRLDHTGGKAATLTLMAGVLGEAGRSDEALKTYREALDLARQIGDKQRAALVLNDLGVFFNTRSRYDDALSQYKQALRLQRELRNRPLEAMALGNIGSVYVTLGNFEEGRTYLQQALAIRENMNLPTETADTLHNLAEASLKIGDYDGATTSYLKALALRRQVGDRRAVGFELYNLGNLFEYQGRYGAAVDSKAEALKIYKELHENDVWLPRVLAAYGSALSQAGNPEQALQVLNEAVPLARALRSEQLLAQILNAQGDVHYYQGDYGKARTLYQQAHATAARGKVATLELTTRLNLAKVDVNNGRSKQAAQTLANVAAAADRAGMKFEWTQAIILGAESDLKLKQYARARNALDAALIQADRLGAKSLLAQAHYLMGLTEVAAGNMAQSRRHRDSARQLLDAIRKDARTDDVLRRSDLRSIAESPGS